MESAWLQTGPLRWQHRALGTLGPWQAQVDTVIGAREREITFHIRLEGHWHEAPMTGFVTLLADIPAGGDITVDVPFSTEPRDPDHEFYHNSLPMDVEVGDLGIGMFERQRPGSFGGAPGATGRPASAACSGSVDGNYYFFKEPLPGRLWPARWLYGFGKLTARTGTGCGVRGSPMRSGCTTVIGGRLTRSAARRSCATRRSSRAHISRGCGLAACQPADAPDNALLSACYAGERAGGALLRARGQGGAIELGLGFACIGRAPGPARPSAGSALS